MKNNPAIVLAIIALITGVIFYFYNKDQQRKEKELEERLAREEEDRKRRFNFFTSKLDDIKKAVRQFGKYLTYRNGYFTNYQLTLWINKYASLHRDINHIIYESIGLTSEDVNTIKTFHNNFNNPVSIRANFNSQFIKDEQKKYNRFFDNVEGRKLDVQQRTAIVIDDDNNIIIAGAGSGKTTTIVGKVNYIIDRYKVSPDEILLISFTNKSASTLADRINISGIEAKTFHKFGKDVIAEVEEEQPSIFDENQFRPLLIRNFKELIKDGNYLQKVTQYFTEFLKPVKGQDEFENQGDYIQYLKDKNFRTYKTKEVSIGGRTTHKMEVVKSIEECRIANFLLFNGVDYEYELPYRHETADRNHRQYKPDFTVNPKEEDSIYLEHFAINKNGKVPHFFAAEQTEQALKEATNKYIDGIKWKRELHKSNGTVLIETYSHEMHKGVLFDNLTNKLLEAGIQLTPKSPEEIWKIISETAKDEVDSFITLFQTFIVLMKSNNYTLDDVINKNNQIKEEFYRKRNALFIQIISPIYLTYEKYLERRKEIDFSDMINKATSYILKKKFRGKYKYIVIDEFQDISIGRYKLLKALKESNPACKLFCVGDDWQSIYRFSGSDIALFKEFENYFGYTVKSKIETTYRFHNPLINLSSEFILKNPNQAKKELKGIGTFNSTRYKIVYSISEDKDDTFALKQIFDELISTYKDLEDKEIFVLGRYSFDINRIKNEVNLFKIDPNEGIIKYITKTEEGAVRKLTAQYLTVHKAKGLEADIVIVINCNSGKHGFPSEMSDDPVLNLLLSEADQFENGEERRLFYVAMTRAKEQLFLVADGSYKSKFISELEMESGITTIKKCPKCKTADLIKRSGTKNGRQWAFYGCSNFLYGCEYQEWVN